VEGEKSSGSGEGKVMDVQGNGEIVGEGSCWSGRGRGLVGERE
jgi:hypothetical protein